MSAPSQINTPPADPIIYGKNHKSSLSHNSLLPYLIYHETSKYQISFKSSTFLLLHQYSQIQVWYLINAF